MENWEIGNGIYALKNGYTLCTNMSWKRWAISWSGGYRSRIDRKRRPCGLATMRNPDVYFISGNCQAIIEISSRFFHSSNRTSQAGSDG